MIPPTSIDGTDITGATIDGQDVQEITVDGQTVFIAQQIVDDFEDGDLSEYGFADSQFEVTQARAFDGSFSIRDDHTEATSLVYAVSTSGLENYPAAGDTIEYRHYIESSSAGTAFAEFIFAAQSETSSPNGYYVKLNESFMSLAKNRLTTLDSVNTATPLDQWLRVEIDWDVGGTINVSIENSAGTQVASLSATDSTYASGGIGFGANYSGAGGGSGLNEEIYWDEVLLI
jgi:hypothetical protein